MSYSIRNNELVCSIGVYGISIGEWTAIDGGGDSRMIISERYGYRRIIRDPIRHSGKCRPNIINPIYGICFLHKSPCISAGKSCSSSERSCSSVKIERICLIMIDSGTVWFDTGSRDFDIDGSASIHSSNIRRSIDNIMWWWQNPKRGIYIQIRKNQSCSAKNSAKNSENAVFEIFFIRHKTAIYL